MRKLMVLLIFALLAIAPLTAQDDAGVLNIYSSRHYGAMEAPFVEFQMATGIEVRVSSGTPRDLLGRLSADVERGNRSVADVFLAIDAGVLSLATERGLLQPVESEILSANIPEDQRDPDGHWYGMSQRVRTVVYYPFDGEHGLTEEEVALLETYADVANPVFEGRLCMRPASHIYTVSLVSSLIHNLGEEEAQAVVEGWTRNTTRYINSDTRQIEAVAAGECDLAVVNHYYVARLRDSADADEVALAESVVLKWLNQDTTDRKSVV
jgi:iron(III) transport system substrate-binding protein